jgi:hypothetical protein
MIIEWVLIAKLSAAAPNFPLELPMWIYQTRAECEAVKREGYYETARAEALYGGDGVKEQFFCHKRVR